MPWLELPIGDGRRESSLHPTDRVKTLGLLLLHVGKERFPCLCMTSPSRLVPAIKVHEAGLMPKVAWTSKFHTSPSKHPHLSFSPSCISYIRGNGQDLCYMDEIDVHGPSPAILPMPLGP